MKTTSDQNCGSMSTVLNAVVLHNKRPKTRTPQHAHHYTFLWEGVASERVVASLPKKSLQLLFSSFAQSEVFWEETHWHIYIKGFRLKDLLARVS